MKQRKARSSSCTDAKSLLLLLLLLPCLLQGVCKRSDVTDVAPLSTPSYGKANWFSAGSQVERVVNQLQHWPRTSPGTDLVEKG